MTKNNLEDILIKNYGVNIRPYNTNDKAKAQILALIDEEVLKGKIEELEKALQVCANHRMDEVGVIQNVLDDRLQQLKEGK